MDIKKFESEMKKNGWVLFPDVLDSAFIERLNQDLDHAYRVCRDTQIKNGIAENNDGSVHHIIALGKSFLEFLEKKPLWDYIKNYFLGNNFILNSLGGIINTPGLKNYASNVHRDVRTFSGELPLMLNMLIMLDDFTEDNGATYLGTGSHIKEEKPSDESFFKNADRAIGTAGSIILFNSNLWHAAGHNKTNAVRRCITPTFTRPFIKQQCDYPRMLGYDYADKLSDDMKQVLGYNSRVPANLDEWYQPPEKRMYKPGQG